MNSVASLRAAYSAWAFGLARARGTPVSSARETPEDVKWCLACGDHHALQDDEAVQGPLNRLYRKFCPICVDDHKEDLATFERTYLIPEPVGDAE